MTNQSRVLWIVGIIVALVLLGQLLAILRWVIGVVILVAIVWFVIRGLGKGSDR